MNRKKLRLIREAATIDLDGAEWKHRVERWLDLISP